MIPAAHATLFRKRTAAILVAASLAGCGGSGSPQPLASIVLVTIDTLRADHLGCYGYFRDTSPRLDAFAREAILFENAIAPMATTLPSHVSLMTATYPLRHGVQNNHQTISPEAPLRSLPAILGDLGYETAAFVSAIPVKRHTGIAAGFDVFDEPAEIERRAEDTNARVLEWIASRESGPFFLWIHYFDPHFRYDPPAPFDSVFATDGALLEWLEEKRVPRRKMERAPENHNGYDGEILYLDGRLGELFDEIKRRGIWDGAAVAVVGDHGEGLGQHDYRDHGHIYNEQLFVPMIVKLPSGKGPVGARSRRVASLVDLVPTLAAALDLPLREEDRSQFDGIDLLDERIEREFVLAERTFPPRQVWEPGKKWALVSECWKYIHLTERPAELYDLAADRNETVNVIHREPEVAERMRNRVLELLEEAERVGAPAPGMPPPEAVEGLRALGYVD